jgi:hypothetical protein
MSIPITSVAVYTEDMGNTLASKGAIARLTGKPLRQLPFNLA